MIRRLLSGERFDYEGEFHNLEDTWLAPVHRAERPIKDKPGRWLDTDWSQENGWPLDIPVMAGTLGPRMLSIMLPHASGWNTHWSDRPFWNRIESFPAIAERIAEASYEAGRNSDHLWSSAEVWAQADRPRGLPLSVPEDLQPLSVDPKTLWECSQAGIDHLIVLVDPQTPRAVQSLVEATDEFRRHTHRADQT